MEGENEREAILDILNFLQEEVEQNKPFAQKAIETIIIKAIWADHAKRQDLPKDSGNFTKQFRLLIPIDYEESTESLTRIIFEFSAQTVLFWYISRKSIEATLTMIQSSVSSMFFEEIEAINKSRKATEKLRAGPTFFAPRFSKDEIVKKIPEEVSKQYLKITNSKLPQDYSKDTKKAILKILQGSVEKLKLGV